MTGLSKITDKILDEARRDAAAKLAAADAEAARISAEYAEKANNITAAANAAAKGEAAEIAMRARSGEKTLRKNALLEAQSELIDRAFAVARKELSELEGEARLDLLTGLLCACLWAEYEAENEREALYGSDGEQDEPYIYEIMLNPRDREKLGPSLMNNFKRRIVGKDMGDLPERVRLSLDTVDIDGGLVLRRGSVEINNSLEAIFSYLRPRLEAEVARILFS
jgi:V/A-type H+-transporting ATPase subunit E